jgi:hypothetical protein
MSFETWQASAVLAFRGLTPSERLDTLTILIGQCSGEELFHLQNALTDRCGTNINDFTFLIGIQDMMVVALVCRLRRDPIAWLPLELAQHLLGYLDTSSLLRAARVSKVWRTRVDGAHSVWKKRSAWLGSRRPDQDEANDVAVNMQ